MVKQKEFVEPAISLCEEKRKRELALRKCRVCGCTDDRACEGGCYWVGPDLCSRCADRGEGPVNGEDKTQMDEDFKRYAGIRRARKLEMGKP